MSHSNQGFNWGHTGNQTSSLALLVYITVTLHSRAWWQTIICLPFRATSKTARIPNDSPQCTVTYPQSTAHIGNPNLYLDHSITIIMTTANWRPHLVSPQRVLQPPDEDCVSVYLALAMAHVCYFDHVLGKTKLSPPPHTTDPHDLTDKVIPHWTCRLRDMGLTVLQANLSQELCLEQDHFVNAPSQWETMLQCNVVSHWLGAKWSLLEAMMSKSRKI